MLGELIHNAALLVAMSALYGLLARFRRPGAVRDKVLSGLLFGGGIAAAVSVALAGAYRGYLGGPGVWAGMATILLCAMVGLAVRRL